MENHSEVVARLRTVFRAGVTIPQEFRLAQLRALLALMEDNEALIVDALNKDLGKPKFEAVLSEIEIVRNDICFAINNLKTWLMPEYVGTNLATKFDDCSIRRTPFGVVLIIGAWNYPLQLILLPLVGAIAAGNCAVLKPSEISQATEQLLANLIPKYLSKECYVVTCGGAEDTKKLLENKFDHIFYTGSQAVARSILRAAADHLTPVTLELGGKCPCLIYGSMDIKITAKRVVWSKYFNCGQSCVAPDYLLCTAETRDALLPAIREALEEFYGPDPQKCQDVGRIVTDKHWNHVMGLLEKSKGRVVIGGESAREEKYIAPTVVVDVDGSDSLMQEEIFGPVLPIITLETVEEAIDFVNARDNQAPLALYAFSDTQKVLSQVFDNTRSGGFCSNDGIVHMTLPTLPFGGVGASGMGCYHGWWSYDTFSHKRACVFRGFGLERVGAFRYPPYSDSNLSWLRWATTTKKSSCSVM
ncbi:aldehyde dehydrogenase family 3 member B1 [Engraulis encrasicolus]|uniref:aldehyde dehydrogenase family 3 member B1 n=1 Tax=Engraulis encrasicolus TaxID=184585 RepID=UPI002FD2124C